MLIARRSPDHRDSSIVRRLRPAGIVRSAEMSAHGRVSGTLQHGNLLAGMRWLRSRRAQCACDSVPDPCQDGRSLEGRRRGSHGKPSSIRLFARLQLRRDW
jgi:hypothetical protein